MLTSITVCTALLGLVAATPTLVARAPAPSTFQAASSIPVAAIAAAARNAKQTPADATYPIGSGSTKATIHSDWVNFSNGAAYVWVADMDVDCDGIDYKCKV